MKQTVSPEELVDDGATVHTFHKNPIYEMPITDRCLNSFDHQFKITFVLHSTSNLENDVIHIFKNYVDFPEGTTCASH